MGLWWIPIGIVAWFLVAVVVGRGVGAVLSHGSRVRESAAPHWGEAADVDEPRWNERQASPGGLGTDARGGEAVLDIPLARASVVIRQREAAIAIREQNVTL